MVFKHFVGCQNFEEVKKRYRSLSMQHHPDKGGNEEIFKELSVEYTKLSKDATISYPIAQKRTSIIEDIMADMAEAFNQSYQREAKRKQNYESQFREARDFARKQRNMRQDQEQATRQEKYWKSQEESDPVYKILYELILDTIVMEKSMDWFWSELFKMEELTFTHFKYIRWEIIRRSVDPTLTYDFNDTFLAEQYRKYCTIQNMEA